MDIRKRIKGLQRDVNSIIKHQYTDRLRLGLGGRGQTYPEGFDRTGNTEWLQGAFLKANQEIIEIRALCPTLPKLDIPSASARAVEKLQAISDWCPDAQAILTGTTPATQTGNGGGDGIKNKPDDESLVRISIALNHTTVSKSAIKQAAKEKKIRSERSGTKKNSPYLVYISEVVKHFSEHGTK